MTILFLKSNVVLPLKFKYIINYKYCMGVTVHASLILLLRNNLMVCDCRHHSYDTTMDFPNEQERTCNVH